MIVELWADVVCPWCYIGTHNLKTAIALFPQRESVQVVYRAFELNASTEPRSKRPVVEMLAEKFGVPVDRAAAMQSRVVGVAKSVGLEMNIEATRDVSSFDAHRLVQYSAKFGVEAQQAMVDALYRANFVDGGDISDIDQLVGIASACGLDGSDVRSMLEGTDYTDDVRVAESVAVDIGVQGVPFYVVNREFAISGAQSSDVILDVLQEAWAEQQQAEAELSATSEDSPAIEHEE